MSLEQAILENTDTMKELIKVWNKLAANATTTAATVKPGDAIVAAGVPIAKVRESHSPESRSPEADHQAAKADVAARRAAEAKDAPDPKPVVVSPPSETAAASPASKPEASTSATVTTYDDVKALVLQVSKEKGRDAAAAVLAGFGVAKAPELKAEQYADAVAQLKAVLK